MEKWISLVSPPLSFFHPSRPGAQKLLSGTVPGNAVCVFGGKCESH